LARSDQVSKTLQGQLKPKLGIKFMSFTMLGR